MKRFLIPFALLSSLLVLFGISSRQASAQAPEWTPPVIEPASMGIEYPQAIVCDPGQKKLYVGARSHDAQRRGLYVFDLGADNTPITPGRRYSDHPDPLPEASTSTIICMKFDARHHKLFMGISSTQPDFATTLVMYSLDEKGEPTGKPEAFATGNPKFSCQAILLHPKLNRLYTCGSGGLGVYAYDLDETGRPMGQPIAFSAGTQGKCSLGMRSDGSKLYLGTYPSTVDVLDLDAAGNASKPRSYKVPRGNNNNNASLNVYLNIAVNDRGVYFKGGNGNLSYFPLDNFGEPVGRVENVANQPVQAVLAPLADRLILATAMTFKDAINGRTITYGTRIKDIAVDPEGAPNRVVRETKTYNRQLSLVLGVSPSVACILAAQKPGFQGNRFAGLNLRVTLLAVDAPTSLPPYEKTIAMGNGKKALSYAYSPTQGVVYALGEDAVFTYPVKGNGDGNITTLGCPNAGDQLALDDASGILFVGIKDGSVTSLPLRTGGS